MPCRATSVMPLFTAAPLCCVQWRSGGSQRQHTDPSRDYVGYRNAQSWHFLLLKTKAASTRPAALYKRTVAELDAIALICRSACLSKNSHSCCKDRHIIVIFQTFSLFFAEFCKKKELLLLERLLQMRLFPNTSIFSL